MTKILAFILLCFSHVLCFAKKEKAFAYFFFNEGAYAALECCEPWLWEINGKWVNNDTSIFKVEINKSEFDTIILRRENSGEKRIIITRFSKDKKYILIPQGCCHDADIFEYEEFKKENALWAKTDHFSIRQLDSLQAYTDSVSLSKNCGKVIFHLLNAKSKDSIGGTYGDIHTNYTSGALLNRNQKTLLDSPLKAESSGFFFPLKLVSAIKADPNFEFTEDGPIAFSAYFATDYYIIQQEIWGLEYRFFNQETLYISYDAHSKKTVLKTL